MGEYKKALFENDFEAWTFGPVCRDLHERYEGHVKTLSVKKEDIDLDALEDIPDHVLKHVDKVLNHFGGLSVIELEDLFIQKEQPWIEARGNAGKHEHSSEVIPKESIYNFHKKK
jgi:uncharacterized phage-associated protein